MKNRYEIRGDVTVIFLRRNDGSELETIIDTTDLPIADSYPGTWYAHWAANKKSFYVMGNLRLPTGRRTSVQLHRWLLQPANDRFVDHVNNNPLDNRRCNLREATAQQNGQNISPTRKRFRARGVYWSQAHAKWRANATVNGRRYHLGLFSSLEEAARVASDFRRRFMPFSAMDQNGGATDALAR